MTRYLMTKMNFSEKHVESLTLQNFLKVVFNFRNKNFAEFPQNFPKILWYSPNNVFNISQKLKIDQNFFTISLNFLKIFSNSITFCRIIFVIWEWFYWIPGPIFYKKWRKPGNRFSGPKVFFIIRERNICIIIVVKMLFFFLTFFTT